MSFGLGFAFPAYPLRGGGGNNPFNQSGPTLDLTFAGVPTDLSDPNGYSLSTDFIVPQYQIAAQYSIWENDVGLVSKTFSQIITFTRASTATYFDATGTLQSAAINTPRFDYNPATLAARGFLIEEARTNLLLYSAAIDNAVSWVPVASTVTANAVISPDGTISTDKLIADNTSAEHTVDQSFTATAGTTYTFSAFVKKADYDFFSLRFTVAGLWGGTSPQVVLNLNTLALANNSGVLTSSVTDVGNGYYRLVMSAACTVSGSPGARLQILGNTSSNSFTGDGVSGTYVWGAQLEIAATTVNSGTASGTTTAVVLSAGSATDDIYNGNVLFVNGEYRVITDYVGATKTATVAALTATPSGAYVVTGGNAAFATSYIPTTTTALTRSADAASVNTLSPWFNVVEGSFVTEWVVSALGVDNNIASLSDGTTSNRHQNYVANTNTVLVRTAASGVASNNQNGTAVANAIGKFAFGYGSGTTAASFNGSAVTTTTQALPSSISTLYLGQGAAGGGQKQIWLRRYTFYPRKLSNVELQAVST